MTCRRHSLATAVLEHKLFAIGGNLSSVTLSCVECFDLRNGEWSMMTPMHFARTHPRAVGLRGRVFVLGWKARRSVGDVLDSGECLDLATGQWTCVPSMNTPRKFSGVVAVEALGKIFALGGTGLNPYGTLHLQHV